MLNDIHFSQEPGAVGQFGHTMPLRRDAIDQEAVPENLAPVLTLRLSPLALLLALLMELVM